MALDVAYVRARNDREKAAQRHAAKVEADLDRIKRALDRIKRMTAIYIERQDGNR